MLSRAAADLVSYLGGLLGFARRSVFDQSCPLQLLTQSQDVVHVHIERGGDVSRGRITPVQARENAGVAEIEIIQHSIPCHGLTLPPTYLWRNTRPAIWRVIPKAVTGSHRTGRLHRAQDASHRLSAMASALSTPSRFPSGLCFATGCARSCNPSD